MTTKSHSFGVTGQDGAYLAELLLAKGYVVHGVKRRSSSLNTARVDHLYAGPACRRARNFFLHYGDMTDATNLIRIVQETQPTEIYNLGGAEPCAGQLRDAGIHRQCRCARHAAAARSDPHPEAGAARRASIRPRPRSSTAIARRRRTRRRRSSRAALMPRPSSTPTGSR